MAKIKVATKILKTFESTQICLSVWSFYEDLNISMVISSHQQPQFMNLYTKALNMLHGYKPLAAVDLSVSISTKGFPTRATASTS